MRDATDPMCKGQQFNSLPSFCLRNNAAAHSNGRRLLPFLPIALAAFQCWTVDSLPLSHARNLCRNKSPGRRPVLARFSTRNGLCLSHMWRLGANSLAGDSRPHGVNVQPSGCAGEGIQTLWSVRKVFCRVPNPPLQGFLRQFSCQADKQLLKRPPW